MLRRLLPIPDAENKTEYSMKFDQKTFIIVLQAPDGSTFRKGSEVLGEMKHGRIFELLANTVYTCLRGADIVICRKTSDTLMQLS